MIQGDDHVSCLSVQVFFSFFYQRLCLNYAASNTSLGSVKKCSLYLQAGK